MSILHRIGNAGVKANFTHYGWFMGIVPVYVKNPDSEGPTLAERDWVPEWYFSAVQWLCLFIGDFMDSPLFTIKITGQIK